ncbi:hypothetical protein [Nonomuraea sp. PA05]|nr:hypothetical protein [Nonomuraea sp. PA05]
MSKTNPETPRVITYPSWEEICFPDGCTPWADQVPASEGEEVTSDE